MSRVVMFAAVSLDGFVADENDDIGPLFDWYFSGTEQYSFGDPNYVFRVTPESKAYLEREVSDIRVCLVGRHLFNHTNGWNGVPPSGEHVVVVTHQAPTDWPFPDAPFAFVTTGVEDAVRTAVKLAGDGSVSVSAGDVGGQVLAAGLIDEVHLALVPAVLGKGKPYFGATGTPALLENPKVVQGDRVTHLAYRVRKD